MSGWACRIPYHDNISRENRKIIFDWLNDNLGMRDMNVKASQWRWSATGGTDRDGCDWFCFRSKKDAMLFKLTFHDILNLVD